MRRATAFVLAVALAAGIAAAQTVPSEKADALAEAARKGDAAAARKLLDEGVDVNTKFRYSRTALSFAADRGHVDVVKLLIERGADVNAQDTFYRSTPLMWASQTAMERKPQHAEIVSLLLKAGARGAPGALMAAVNAGDGPMTKVILDQGAPPADALTNALEAAKRGNKTELVAMLEQAGAKPRVEFKIDPAQLARYAGTYRGPNDAELVITVDGGRLIGSVQGQRLTFLARDATTFGAQEAPQATLTIRLEGDKVASVGFPNNAVTWTRIEK